MPEMTAADVVEFAEEWVEALASGDYEQTQHCLVIAAQVGLQQKRAYCCLGVGTCVVEHLPTVKYGEGEGHTDTPDALLVYLPGQDMTLSEDGFYANGEENFPPPGSKTEQVIDALGMEASNLTQLNDTDERNFAFIGGYISAHLEKYKRDHAEELEA